MSWLSNQLSSVGNFGQHALISPITNVYNKNKTAILDAAALAAIGASGGALAAGGAGGMAAGTGALLGGGAGLLSGAIQGSDVDAARHEELRAQNNKIGATNDLNNLLPGIGAPITNNPYPTTPKDPTSPTQNGPYTLDPSTGQQVYWNEPTYDQLVNSGQISFNSSGNPMLGQPASGVGGNLTSTSPGNVGQNTNITGNTAPSQGNVPVNSTSSNIDLNLAQQDPALAKRMNDILGTGTDQATLSAKQIANANDLATQLSTQTLNTQASDRTQQISDLSNLLTQQAQTQYQRSLPGLYEDLNTRGLLRSSDLGNQMAAKEQQSYQDVANQLAQTQLGYNDQYITGLGNITNQYNSGVSSALQREQSLQDYANQVAASLKLGQAVTPVQPSGKSNTSIASNAMGKAGAGASLANAFTKK